MSGEKTEEASEHKLEEEREKGNVPKSPDLAMAISTLAVFIVLIVMGDTFLEHLHALVRSGLDFGNGDLPLTELYKRIGSMTIDGLWVIAPLALTAAIFGAVGMLSHVGAAFSMEPVVPKPEKVDPVAGLKRNIGVYL